MLSCSSLLRDVRDDPSSLLSKFVRSYVTYPYCRYFGAICTVCNKASLLRFAFWCFGDTAVSAWKERVWCWEWSWGFCLSLQFSWCGQCFRAMLRGVRPREDGRVTCCLDAWVGAGRNVVSNKISETFSTIRVMLHVSQNAPQMVKFWNI